MIGVRRPGRVRERWVGDNLAIVLGAVLILIVFVLIGPVALFMGGAVWSALHGWLQSEDADQRAATPAEG